MQSYLDWEAAIQALPGQSYPLFVRVTTFFQGKGASLAHTEEEARAWLHRIARETDGGISLVRFGYDEELSAIHPADQPPVGG